MGPGTSWGSICPCLKEVVAGRKKKINADGTLMISFHEDQPVHDLVLSNKIFWCILLKKFLLLH